MNVFVLNTGRCGSKTFVEACKHITNYTAAHESRCSLTGNARLQYTENHIESDNRLSWFLGKLEKTYGDNAFYVHLRRNDIETAQSYTRQGSSLIMKAYHDAVLIRFQDKSDPSEIGLDFCNTVNTNIELFLKDKSRKMNFSLENAKEDFREFWNQIGAEGDLPSALSEWDIHHNSFESVQHRLREGHSLVNRFLHKLIRLGKAFPNFVRNA